MNGFVEKARIVRISASTSSSKKQGKIPQEVEPGHMMLSCDVKQNSKQFGLLLRIADRRVTQTIDRHLYRAQLNADEYRILVALHEAGGHLSQYEVAERLMLCNEDQLVLLIGDMRLHNMLRREFEEDAPYLSITNFGCTMLEVATQLVDEAHEEIAAQVGTVEFSRMMKALEKIAHVDEYQDLHQLLTLPAKAGMN